MNEVVIIYIIHTSLIKEHFSFVSNFVDNKRREKANKYINEKDQLLSLGAGFLLKKYLPNGEIKEKSNGKPYLENGPYFNLSHSGEYIVLAIHPTREVGIDTERINPNKLDGIYYVLNEEEKKATDPNELFQIWSNKESLIKCLSTGLKDIRNVRGLPLEGKRIFEGEEYFTKSMIYNNYSLSLSLKGDEPFNIKINPVDIREEQ